MIDRRSPLHRREIPDRRIADRRDEPRDKFETEIRFLRAESSADEILHGELLDVSATGIRVLLDDPLELSDRILVEVRGPGNRCFNLTAQVIWLERHGDHRQLVGCELCVELTAKQRALLQKLSASAN